jgi:hypothetical protein
MAHMPWGAVARCPDELARRRYEKLIDRLESLMRAALRKAAGCG